MTEKISTERIAPMAVAVIGTGDGRLQDTVATTPQGQPNLVVQVVTPVLAIIVRAINLFFVTLSGTLTVQVFTNGSLKAMMIQTGIIVAVGIVKDCATVFTGLERRYPLGTGSI